MTRRQTERAQRDNKDTMEEEKSKRMGIKMTQGKMRWTLITFATDWAEDICGATLFAATLFAPTVESGYFPFCFWLEIETKRGTRTVTKK